VKTNKLPIRSISMFLLIFTTILFGSHFYMWARIDYYLSLSVLHKVGLALWLGGLPLLTLFAMRNMRRLPKALAKIVAWIIYPWMGIALLFFVTLLVTDSLWLILQLVPDYHLPEPRAFLQHCFGIMALSTTSVLVVFSLYKGLQAVSVKSVTIFLERLPASFNGLRIVQMTDLHIGPLIKGDWLRRVVQRVNLLQPDIIVITGDLVDGSVHELRHHVEPLAHLQSKYGTYFVTGNHEYYSGVEEWCAYLTSLGVQVLRNRRVTIQSSAAESFELVGVDDWASHHFPGGGANLAKALQGYNTDSLLLLLAHQPAAVIEAAEYGVDLQLSGHTHGGQIWPFNYLVPLQQPYIKGLSRHKDTRTQIYVSSGTGFWGPPMRLGTQAEITHITVLQGI